MNLELDDPKTKKKSWVYLIFHVNLVKKAQLLVSVRCYLVFISGVNF